MATIRRLYVYVVCLISLQAVAAAGNALLRGLIRQVAGASLVVAPSTAMSAGAVAGSPAPKVVVPIAGPGLHWVGVAPMPQPGTQVAQVVAQLLRTLPRPAPSPLPAEAGAPAEAPEAGPPADASPAP